MLFPILLSHSYLRLSTTYKILRALQNWYPMLLGTVVKGFSKYSCSGPSLLARSRAAGGMLRATSPIVNAFHRTRSSASTSFGSTRTFFNKSCPKCHKATQRYVYVTRYTNTLLTNQRIKEHRREALSCN